MKFSTALSVTSLIGSVSAFVPHSPNKFASSALAATKKATADDENKPVEFSIAIPFMERPPLLDGTMAGDVGFDPLGIAQDEVSLPQTNILSPVVLCSNVALF